MGYCVQNKISLYCADETDSMSTQHMQLQVNKYKHNSRKNKNKALPTATFTHLDKEWAEKLRLNKDV